MKEIFEINEVHNILYDALCYLDDFCNDNKIKYYLSNGTLLGAAKYGDFVPWDDDVDILMPRESYDRLMQMKEINNSQYRLLCKQQVDSWRMPYAKLSYEETVLEEGSYDFGASFGLNLDIFPIDNWHPCKVIAKVQSLEMELLKRMLVVANGGEFSTNKRGIKRVVLHLIWCVGKKIGHQEVCNMIEQKTQKSKKYRERSVGCVAWTCHATNEVLPKSIFQKTIYLSLRGRQFPVFEGYEEYLDKLYGKWREELPVDQQHSNHAIKVWRKNASELL